MYFKSMCKATLGTWLYPPISESPEPRMAQSSAEKVKMEMSPDTLAPPRIFKVTS